MNLLFDIAMGLCNGQIPYVWGGKCPLAGLDCSGLTQYILQSVGMGPENVRSAQGQYQYWLVNGVKSPPQLGALVFFGNDIGIDHIGFCIDTMRMVEAAHGDENCTSRVIAALKGAYVKVSPIKRRTDLISCLMPDYHSVGL